MSRQSHLIARKIRGLLEGGVASPLEIHPSIWARLQADLPVSWCLHAQESYKADGLRVGEASSEAGEMLRGASRRIRMARRATHLTMQVPTTCGTGQLVLVELSMAKSQLERA